MGVMMSRRLLIVVLALVLSALAPTTNALAGGLSEAERQQVGLEINRPYVTLEIRFEADTTDVTPGSLSELIHLGKALSDAQLKSATFMIAVYADAIDDPKSLDLAERRAETIRQYLVSNFKMDADRLVTSALPASADNHNRVRVINMSDKPSEKAAPEK
jgi:outer membrane protein OmpA-like peptidoglycan-associated protein